MTKAATDTVPTGTRLYRVADPQFGITFKRIAPQPCMGGRFDCVDGRYGYSYFADEAEVALAEVFTRDLAPSTEIRTIPASRLSAAALQTVDTLVPVDVQLLHGKHLTRIGETANLTKSEPHDYPRTRAVAAQLIASLPGDGGLRYRPRHDEDGFAYLLYSTNPDQELTQIVEQVGDDRPLGHGEGLELATLMLARYNVSVER